MTPGTVILGAGLAGGTVAATLRANRYEGSITLVGEDAVAPYHRPPLSKQQLREGGGPTPVRPPKFWEDKEIQLRLGVRATSVDRENRAVALDDGTHLEYGNLVFATGSRNREIPGAVGGVALRTSIDAGRLREQLHYRQGKGALVVVGGGFIGLEVASTAASLGLKVIVVEALPTLMARVVSLEMSEFFRSLHEAAGVRIMTNRRVSEITSTRVLLDDGEVLPADVAVIGVGVVPNDELAASAGLDCDDGILVDARLQTADPSIWAVGDCARFPCAIGGRDQRLESVQSATDQARAVGHAIARSPAPYRAVPWFWTEQVGRRLQIAGAAPYGAESVKKANDDGGFSICRYVDQVLVAVESVDSPTEHMAARRLLADEASHTVMVRTTIGHPQYGAAPFSAHSSSA